METSQTGACTAKVQKPWSKLKTDEKIERMREIIKQKDDKINCLSREFNQARNEFISHYHKEDRLCQDIKRYSGLGDSMDSCRGRIPRQNPDEVYF